MTTYAKPENTITSYAAYAGTGYKLAGSIAFALLITVSLILLMKILISEEYTFVEPEAYNMPTVVMPKPKPPVVKPKEAEKPLPPEAMPQRPQESQFEPQKVANTSFVLGPVVKDVTGPELISAQEGEPIPYLRVEPTYPSRALGRGTEGHVDLRFDITATGATAAIQVTQGNPQGVFDRAAVRAVSKWKYKPRVKDGKAVEKKGVTTRVRFQIADD